MVTSRYEIICNLEEDFLKLINNGFISVHFLAWKTIYESYLKEIKKMPKMVTYCYLAEYYNLSETQIRNIVKFMS